MKKTKTLPHTLALAALLLFSSGQLRAQQWQRVEALPAGQTTVLHRVGDTLFAAGLNKLYLTHDGGATWNHFNPGTDILGSARFALAGDRMIANLAKPAALSFMFYSDDQGMNWQPFEPGFTGSFGYDITFCKGRLFSARDNGLWRLEPSTDAGEPDNAGAALEPNFPNPFFGNTTLSFTLLEPGWVELSVFSLSGSPVHSIWSGDLPAGVHRFEFNSEDLAPGAYVCRLARRSGYASRWMLKQN